MRRKGLVLEVYRAVRLENMLLGWKNHRKRKVKACIAYRDFLISAGVDSCQNGTDY